MNTFKKAFIVGAIALSGLSLAGAAVFAQNAVSPMNLSVNNSGEVHLVGTVSAVNGSTISVSSWGGTWTVNNVSNTQVKVGDTVKVEGNITTGMSLNAKKVVDKAAETARKVVNGTVGNINVTAGTFTLATANMGTVNVVVNASTKVWLNSNVSSLASLTAGAQATVSGSFNASTNTITAANVVVPSIKKDGDDNGNHNGWFLNLGGKIMGWFKH